jgi:type III pantothenate kinase
MTFLAIDVGNTRLKWALYDAHRPAQRSSRMVPSSWTTSTAWPKQLGQLPAPTRMLGCVVAGTLPSAGCKQMEQMVRWDVEPRWVVPSAEEAGLVNGYDHPSRLGADRWVAMVGARHHVLARARRGRWWW